MIYINVTLHDAIASWQVLIRPGRRRNLFILSPQQRLRLSTHTPYIPNPVIQPTTPIHVQSCIIPWTPSDYPYSVLKSHPPHGPPHLSNARRCFCATPLPPSPSFSSLAARVPLKLDIEHEWHMVARTVRDQRSPCFARGNVCDRFLLASLYHPLPLPYSGMTNSTSSPSPITVIVTSTQLVS